MRGLLTGTHIGLNAMGAIAWILAIGVLSYFWAMRLYHQRRAHD